MALELDKIRATADRIAASHSLDIVELDFSGGAKFRTLRVFLEKNAETRAKLTAEAAASEASELPKGVATELLSFTTHEDCEVFTRDFGTVLDIEDLIPGAEYTLEVSSPGLERKLTRPADFTRFTRLPRQAPDLLGRRRQPPLLRPAHRLRRRRPHPRPLRHQAERQTEKGRRRQGRSHPGHYRRSPSPTSKRPT